MQCIEIFLDRKRSYFCIYLQQQAIKNSLLWPCFLIGAHCLSGALQIWCCMFTMLKAKVKFMYVVISWNARLTWFAWKTIQLYITFQMLYLNESIFLSYNTVNVKYFQITFKQLYFFNKQATRLCMFSFPYSNNMHINIIQTIYQYQNDHKSWIRWNNCSMENHWKGIK